MLPDDFAEAVRGPFHVFAKTTKVIYLLDTPRLCAGIAERIPAHLSSRITLTVENDQVYASVL